MNKPLLRGVVGLAVCAVGASHAWGQWSPDGASNLTVAGGAGDQGVPLVRPTLDGGAWIAFADNSAGAGYKHVIQRVTAKGVVAFSGMGIQLDNRTNTATFVFDMDVDATGNAIVAMDNSSIYVQKVLPNGTLAWGAAGVMMPGSTGAVGPQIAALSDGTYVCCWGLSNILNFQRINSDGTLGAAWTYADAGHYQAICDLLGGSGSGEVISLWVRGSTTSATSSIKGLRLQKWDSTNAQAWNAGAPIEIMTYLSGTPGRTIQNGYFPPMISDHNGGAIVAWYDVGNANRQARLQHVLSDGTPRFVADGLPLSTTTSATEYRSGASVAYDVAGDAYTIGYERSNPAQSLWGMAAQRVDAAGNLLWNSGAGIEIVPFGSFHAASFINAARGPDHSTIFTWIQYQGANSPMVINATRMDAAGGFVWTPTTLGVSTTPNTKGRLGAALTSRSGMIIAGWADGAAGSADIQAQNINVMGTLGPTCDADLDDGSVAGYPDGGVDINDLLYFLAQYEAGSIAVDLDDGSGTGTPDAGVDINDLLFFLAHYEAGC